MVKLGISMSFSTNQKASKDLWISGGNPPGLTTLTEIILRASIFLEHHCLHLFYLQDSRTTTTLFRNWKTLTIVISWQNLDRLKLNFKSIICKLLNSKGLFRSKGQFKSFAKFNSHFCHLQLEKPSRFWSSQNSLPWPQLPVPFRNVVELVQQQMPAAQAESRHLLLFQHANKQKCNFWKKRQKTCECPSTLYFLVPRKLMGSLCVCVCSLHLCCSPAQGKHRGRKQPIHLRTQRWNKRVQESSSKLLELLFGLSPFPVRAANEGLVRDPRANKWNVFVVVASSEGGQPKLSW